MTEQAVCLSCKVRITNMIGVTRFLCPKCSKEEIVRCFHCREIATKFKCKSCGFEGPN